MNIATVIFRAERERGGAERYAIDLSNELIRRGHSVDVLAATHGDCGAATPVPIFAGGLTRASRYERFIDNVQRHVDARPYDAVHAHLPVRSCDVYSAQSGLELFALRDGHRAKPTLPRQFVAMLTNRLSIKRNRVARVEAALLNAPRPPITVCLSDRERHEAARAFPHAASRMATMYCLPDDSRFDPEGLPARRKQMRKILGLGDAVPMFVFAGQDFERKGLATALRALALAKNRGAVLYVLGGGDVGRYSRQALRAGVVGRALFPGRVENVADYLAAADGFVLPTRYEPFGMVVVESMLMGCPPIVSAVAGASEVVGHDRTGFVIEDVNDAAAYAAAMDRLCDAPASARLREACLAERDRFSYARQVDTIEALYRKARA